MKSFSIKRVFAYSWEIYKKNFLLLGGLCLFIWALSAGFQLLGGAIIEEMSVPLGMLLLFAGWVITTMLSMGFLYLGLEMARKKHVSQEDVLHPAPCFIQYVIVSLLYSAIVFVGLLLFIVPGVIWAIRYGFYQYLVIDKCANPFRALYISGQLTKGHTWKLFLLGLALIVLNLLGVLLVGVGLLVTVPLSVLIGARVYDRLLMTSKIKFSE